MSVYKDPNRTVKERVDDLISQMTIEEKVAQLSSRWHQMFFLPDNLSHKAYDMLRDGLGTLSWLLPPLEPEENVKVMNKIQKYAVEKTRLGIPVLFHGEALAGGLFYGATYFPTAIGLASTWEPELISQMAMKVSRQMRVYGVRIVFSPVLDVARDPRWGRIGETYGEDPYLISQMGMAFVSGMQGDDLKDGTAATGKHFLGYAAGEGGRNKDSLNVGKRELYEIYARPFEAVIRNADVKAIMNSYGIIDNVPVAGSREIMTGLLKKQLGFTGLVVSDYGSVAQLYAINRSASDKEEAAVTALTAGIDIEQPEPATFPQLITAFKSGRLSIETIDEPVRKVLALKFELGLFEKPYAEGKVKQLIDEPDNRKLAKRIASKSIVLLKNENGLLPIDKNISSIAVIGPNSNQIRSFFGGYSAVAMREIVKRDLTSFAEDEKKDDLELPEFDDSKGFDGFARYFYKESMSVLDALKKAVSSDTRVVYEKGCEITGDSKEGFADAVAAARSTQLAVVVLGGFEGIGSTTTCGEGRDRTDLSLPGVQQDLLVEIHKTGVPVVLIIINSRPLSISWAKEHIPAIIQAWTPGEQGGQAIADVLLGSTNPAGRLPVTIPKNVGQIPLYYNRKLIYEDMGKTTAYIDDVNGNLYPFGHGLSYSEFEYSDLDFGSHIVRTNGVVRFSFKVKNTSKRTGEEVVQVYFRDREANVARPVKELTGFKRISLDPGQSCRISFEIKLDMLAFYDRDMRFVVEPGNHDVFIGASSEDIRLTGEFKAIGETVVVKGARSFSAKSETEYL